MMPFSSGSSGRMTFSSSLISLSSLDRGFRSIILAGKTKETSSCISSSFSSADLVCLLLALGSGLGTRTLLPLVRARRSAAWLTDTCW